MTPPCGGENRGFCWTVGLLGELGDWGIYEYLSHLNEPLSVLGAGADWRRGAGDFHVPARVGWGL